MITQAEDYKYVDGELDTILVNGGIMPLRSNNIAAGTNWKNCLRGEDIVFLAEAARERLLWWNSVTLFGVITQYNYGEHSAYSAPDVLNKKTFINNLNRFTYGSNNPIFGVDDILGQIRILLRKDSTDYDTKSITSAIGSSIPERIQFVGEYDHPNPPQLDPFIVNTLQAPDVSEIASVDFEFGTRDLPIKRSNIETMFSAMSKMRSAGFRCAFSNGDVNFADDAKRASGVNPEYPRIGSSDGVGYFAKAGYHTRYDPDSGEDVKDLYESSLYRVASVPFGTPLAMVRQTSSPVSHAYNFYFAAVVEDARTVTHFDQGTQGGTFWSESSYKYWLVFMPMSSYSTSWEMVDVIAAACGADPLAHLQPGGADEWGESRSFTIVDGTNVVCLASMPRTTW